MKKLSLDLKDEILDLLKLRGGSRKDKYSRGEVNRRLEEFGFREGKFSIDFRKLAERYGKCHRDAIAFYCEQCGEVYIVPYACNLVICEHCSKRRARAIYRRYYGRIKAKNDLKHVTLTWGHEVLNGDILRGIYEKFVKLLKRFWKSFVTVLEISKTGHIHLHAIVSGVYVPQKVLSRTADGMFGKQVVWINRAVPKKLGYLVKYISKPPSFDRAKDYLRFLMVMHRFRRVRSYGEFYGGDGKKEHSLFCRECGWYLSYEGIKEEGWWKGEYPYLYEGYDPPYEVIMMYGGMM